MIDIFEFPHVPYWFTVKQGVILLKSMNVGSKVVHPQVVLVFEEKYNLIGILSAKEVLAGLEPRYLSTAKHAQVMEEDESSVALIWDAMFDHNNKELADRPISEVMFPATHFLYTEDPLTKAAYMMVHYNLDMLPVIEHNKKLIGIVRISEIFDELSAGI
ncbi:MAG: CBS domain-containing protein [Nitrospirae bacterium]|nr:CBS domain-containing protein [Nitrospirota bacterium]